MRERVSYLNKGSVGVFSEPAPADVGCCGFDRDACHIISRLCLKLMKRCGLSSLWRRIILDIEAGVVNVNKPHLGTPTVLWGATSCDVINHY